MCRLGATGRVRSRAEPNGVGANTRSEEDWASAGAVTASNSIGSIIVKARAAKATATAVDLQFGGQR